MSINKQSALNNWQLTLYYESGCSLLMEHNGLQFCTLILPATCHSHLPFCLCNQLHNI